MMASFKKLKKIAAVGSDRRSQKQLPVPAKDDIAQATMNMNDMRDCYERLLLSAASMANSVYEFSESLKEMGDCLLEKTALNDDEESGKVLLMLGKAQFELQKLADSYRLHISQTISIPSESLLNELQVVEVMKDQCDDKREIYEELKSKHKEKRRLSNSKDESIPSFQLQEAQNEFEEEANAFVFRVKSLKQGQSRSFLTQASRHHAAQLSFFRRAVKSLESIEPHVKLLSEHYHIDYKFIEHRDSGPESYDEYDDRSDMDDDTDDDSGTPDFGELSFNYRQNHPSQDTTESRNSMEEFLKGTIRYPFSARRETAAISKSAPLFPGTKLNPAERGVHLRSSLSGKFVSYVLPTPDETRSPQVSGKLSNETPQKKNASSVQQIPSSPDVKKNDESGSTITTTMPTSVLNENKSSTKKASPLPAPPTDAFYAKKAKTQQSFSGPLIGNNRWPGPQQLSNSNTINSSAFPPFSGPLLRNPSYQPPLNSKPSSHASAMFVSSPKISELHELPRPPAPVRSPHLTAYSAPLVSRTVDPLASAVSVTKSSITTSTPQVLSRSNSIPGRAGHVPVALRDLPEKSQKNTAENVSPRATPMSLQQRIQPASPSS